MLLLLHTQARAQQMRLGGRDSLCALCCSRLFGVKACCAGKAPQVQDDSNCVRLLSGEVLVEKNEQELDKGGCAKISQEKRNMVQSRIRGHYPRARDSSYKAQDRSLPERRNIFAVQLSTTTDLRNRACLKANWSAYQGRGPRLVSCINHVT
jgi:hypothetical protein